jgi:site-specific recombinase XerC
MNPTATSVLSSTLHGFFTDYLLRQRAMSPHTLHSYRDSLKLLLRFVAGKKHDPSTLTVEQFTVNQILAFLNRDVGTRLARATFDSLPFTVSFGIWEVYILNISNRPNAC